MSIAHLAATHRPPQSTSARHPHLARALWQWLALGGLLLLALPAARGHSLWFGPGLFWLLAAPLASLSMFYRHAVAAGWRGVRVPEPRRRRPRSAARQARRLGFGPQVARIRQRAA